MISVIITCWHYYRDIFVSQREARVSLYRCVVMVKLLLCQHHSLLLCMFLCRWIEEMVFIQENRIEYRSYDVASKPWLLSTDSLNRSPFNFSLNMSWNLELALCWKISVDLQKSFLFSFWSFTCTDLNELRHEFVQHFVLLPCFKRLSWRALSEIEILKVERQHWQVVLDLTFRSHIGGTAVRSCCTFELVVKLTFLFCSHTP